MYRILIVDDEPGICEGLDVMIPWNEYGFEVGGFASNGREALEKLADSEYYLVITDIRMPVMDGLGLAKHVSRLYPGIKMIILSGYSEFNYAKKAMDYGVKAYLLKPLSRDEIIEQLIKAKEERDKEKADDSLLKENIEIGRRAFLYDLAAGLLSGHEIRDNMSKYGIAADGAEYLICLLEIEGFLDIISEDRKKARDIKRGLKRISDMVLLAKKAGYAYEDAGGIVGLFLYGSGLSSRLDEVDLLLSEIRLWSFQRLNIELSVSKGICVSEAADVRVSRDRAYGSLGLELIKGESAWAVIKDKGTFEGNPSDLGSCFKELVSGIEECNIPAIKNNVSAITERIRPDGCNGSLPRKFIYSLAFYICSLIGRHGGDTGSIFDKQEMDDLLMDSAGINYIRLEEWLLLFCTRAADLLSELTRNRTKRIVDQVMEYIDIHFAEEISIKSVASVFYFNTAYLGQVIKRVTGMSFNDYLNRKRIQAAKKLFLEDSCRVSEIIERVGYKSNEYFYKQFKRYEGISFAEFKDGLQQGML